MFSPCRSVSILDYCNYNSSGVVLHCGGNYNQNQNHGLFYLNGNNTASNTNANIGCRHLCKGNSYHITSPVIRFLRFTS